MNKNAKIYIAGHRGLVGSALVRRLTTAPSSPSPLAGKGRGEGAQARRAASRGAATNESPHAPYTKLLTRTHAELDLTNQAATETFFAQEKPDYVFLAAAKVGGIHANNTYPAEFIRDNLAIQTNIIHAAYTNKVKRLMFLGSSCIYPKLAPQPMKEESLLTGPLEPTNRPYALAKIAGIEMCWSYNRQYGTQYLAVMPTNLYGPGDNYHPDNSHVIPALIRKFHEAKQAKAPSVSVWGTGTPRRKFMYSDDMADACIHLMNLPDSQLVGQRRAPATYRIVVGDRAAVGGGIDKKLAEMRFRFAGKIPDGLLFRVSSIDPEIARAYAIHASFINQLLAAVTPEQRLRLAGSFGKS